MQAYKKIPSHEFFSAQNLFNASGTGDDWQKLASGCLDTAYLAGQNRLFYAKMTANHYTISANDVSHGHPESSVIFGIIAAAASGTETV